MDRVSHDDQMARGVEAGHGERGRGGHRDVGRQIRDLLRRMHALHRDQHAARARDAAPRRTRTSRDRRTRARSRRRTAPRMRSPRRAAACARRVAQVQARSPLASGTRPSCDWGRPASTANRAARSRAECPGRPPPEPTSSTRRAVALRQVRQHRERVEQVMRDHARGLANRGQVVGLVPLREQRRGTRAVARAAPRSAARPERVDAAAERLGRSTRALVPEHSASARALTPTGATAPAPRFRWTSSSEMAAGVMPEMRAAWPTVSGLPAASFCRASVDSPRTSR